jgi:ribosome-binding protein aMBF1 (putative translation factor)
MTLDDYRRKKGWTYSELARLVGASQATVVRRWCLPADDKNRLIPNQKNMDKIVLLTQSEVMPNDFYLRRD